MMTREEAWEIDIAEGGNPHDPFYIQEQALKDTIVCYIVGHESRFVYEIFSSRKPAYDCLETMQMKAFLEIVAKPQTRWQTGGF